MPIIRGFFFDLDGTLIDSYEADFLAYREAIEEVTGQIIQPKVFAKWHGHDMRAKLKGMGFHHLSEADIQRIADGKKRYYPQYVHQTRLNPALAPLLNLGKEHIRVLVTTAKRQNALLALAHHNIQHHFSYMVFGDEVDNPKPHPEPYLRALKLSGLKPEEVIVFEDSDTGVAAAEAAGLTVVRVGDWL